MNERRLKVHEIFIYIKVNIKSRNCDFILIDPILIPEKRVIL